MRQGAIILGFSFISMSLGVYVGRLSMPKSAVITEPPPPVSCGVSIDPSVLRTELARALANVAPTLAPPSSPPKDPQQPSGAATEPAPAIEAVADSVPEPSATEIAAYDSGQVVLERAIQLGRMSVAESREIQAAMLNMDERSRLETSRRVIQAMNQGKLQIENRETPF
jgi:hypothetical protein